MDLKDLEAHATYWEGQVERIKPHLPDPEIEVLLEIAEKNRINYTAEFLVRTVFE